MTGIISDNAARTSGLIKPAGGGGAWNLIKSQTASSSSSISLDIKFHAPPPDGAFINPELSRRF